MPRALRRPPPWAVYLALGTLACAAYVFPSPLQGNGPLINLIGLSPVIAILAGVRRHRPAARLAWLLLAAGSALFWFGDLYTYSFPLLLHVEVPFPSPGDASYIAMYPVMMAGLLLLVRRRSAGTDRGAMIDGMILTVGLALPSWIALIAPYLHQHDVGLLAKMVSVAYPMGDVILLGGVVRLALDSGRREPAFRLLTGSVGLLLVTDFVYGVLMLKGLFTHQLWLDAGWIGSYLLWGAAGLHPTMARLAEPVAGRTVLLTRFRLTLLTCGALVGPTLSAVADLRDGDFDYLVIEASSIALFGLVILRMAGLARQQRVLSEELHRHRGEARFGALVRQASDLIVVLGPDLSVSYSSPSVARILGGELLDRLASEADRTRLTHAVAGCVAGEAVHPLECALLARDGLARDFEIRLTNLTGEEHVDGILLNARDVSERKAFEAELTHQAFHDTVTGLANRAMFTERVRQAIARARREAGTLAIVFLDLDDFKTVNDSLGHAAGDEVLVAVARRLDADVRGADTAARFGGDEFAILLEGIGGSQDAADAAERVLALLARPLRAGHRELTLRGSIGVSVAVAGDGRGAEELIRDADAAMYTAKREGKGAYRLFEPAMHADVLARLELRNDLQRAIDDEQFELHYQPVVRLAGASIAGFEALLRWRHPERGLIAPLEFIPIAEETGLIVPIGRWVLHEAAVHARRLERLSRTPLRMNVNLSVKQLQHPGVVADVRAALDASGLEPARLVLELTESVLMDDVELAVARLAELKGLGVRLALDDFGTGYSSLSYLSRFPVDYLKLDRSFLHDDAPVKTRRGLANAVIGLGATLGIEVVAEGIEHTEEWDTLRDLGCDFGQGYLFARPLDAAASLDFLAAGAVTTL